MVDIVDEVNDEIKQQKLEAFWKENGAFIVICVICVIVAVAGKSWWVNHKATQNIERTSALITTMVEQENVAPLVALADDLGGSQETIARFLAAGLTLNDGDDLGTAIAQYDAIAENSNLGEAYVDLAVLLGASARIEQGGDAVGVAESSLNGLVDSNSFYRHSARELLAVLKADAGDFISAVTILETAMNDAALPGTMRARLQALHGIYTVRGGLTSATESEG